MMQRWKWKNILFIGLILLGVPGISLFRSKYSLGLSEYEICSSRIVSDIRIVQLTDLHNSTFGDNNADLIAPVLGTGGRRFESCRPDFRKLRRIKSS